MVTCAHCGTKNEASRRFCLECGQRLVIECAVCGVTNPAGAKFCGDCGNRLGATGTADISGEDAMAVPATSRTSAGDGSVDELRLVSVLFIDLVGFTPLSERLDAEDVRELLSRYFEIARQIVDRHGGIIEKFIGDAVMAVWGTPVAHEDDAERAVRTALQLVEAVSHIDAAGEYLQARAGVLTGAAAVTVAGAERGMVIGDLVNTASRLQSVAEPGTVLVGDATYRATSGAIAYEPVAPQSLKGKALPVAGWRAVAVVARRGGEGRSANLEPPFVGRDEELRSLKDQFHAAEREGKPRLVTIVGQAGIGKSRLAWELEKYLDGLVDTILWHEGRSPSYGDGISYWALAEIVRGRAGIAESDDPAAARVQLATMLDEIVPDPVERRWIEPRLAGLLGLEDLPVETREELFAAWRTFFERLAAQSTTMLVFWDLQWADQGLLDFIEHLLTWARSSPVFVLAEARPELFDRRPGWGAAVRHAASIHLDPLGDDDMRQLLVGLVPGLPEQALRAIVERAEGVPLYAVETLRMLIDRNVLRRESDEDRYVLAAELPGLTVPESLHALIAARLDTLPPVERSLLTDAAVLGLSFTVRSLEALSDLAGEALAGHLDRLVRHEILVLDSEPRSPERGQYRFVQGVIREVAYQSLAKRERRAKHLAAARYLESLGDEELAGVLASHYLASWQATPAGPEADALAAQARVALRAAADRASALHSLEVALGHLEGAITVTSDPRERALLHERAATAATYSAQVTRGFDHAREAEAIFATLDDRLGVLRARSSQANARLAEHGDRAALEILERALADVADLPPAPEIASAQSELARTLMLASSPEAIAWADKVLRTPTLVSPLVLVETLITKATVQLNAGLLVEGEVGLRGAIAVADRLGDPMSSLRARNNLFGRFYLVSLDDVLALVREMHGIALRFGQRTWVQQAIGVGLGAAFEAGRWDDWVTEADEEAPLASSFYRDWFRAEMARRLAYRGRPDEATAIIDDIVKSDTVKVSRQAMVGYALTLAEMQMLGGRWTEAFESARHAWDEPEFALSGFGTSMLAAVGAADPERLAAVIRYRDSQLTDDEPMTIASRQVGTTFEAIFEGRWDDVGQAYLLAVRTLDEVRSLLMLALFQMAVGHHAAGRIPEAAEALAAAESFFSERGAGAVVSGYRAMALPLPGGTAGDDRQAGHRSRAVAGARNERRTSSASPDP